ncbi:hypothetical protein J4727_07460 [Providencia rettgeri]|uniref:Uncharacterized protein n=1 Tax=Providencia rettgeri TaxID=587 RepID=A0A939NG37_PRORE|nr:hypothetical protein [Providencia rettgeri]
MPSGHVNLESQVICAQRHIHMCDGLKSIKCGEWAKGEHPTEGERSLVFDEVVAEWMNAFLSFILIPMSKCRGLTQ